MLRSTRSHRHAAVMFRSAIPALRVPGSSTRARASPLVRSRSIQSAAEAASEASYARGLFFGVNNEDQVFELMQCGL